MSFCFFAWLLFFQDFPWFQIRQYDHHYLFTGSLQNSGAKYVGNKMPRQFQNFLVCLGNVPAKKLPKTQKKSMYITSALALAYVGILPRSMIWFFNSWDYLFRLNYFVYLYHTWTGETEEYISLVDHFFLVSSYVLVIVREHIHCVKSVQIRSFFWSVFFRIRTEYGEIRSISPYSVRMRENTDQK